MKSKLKLIHVNKNKDPNVIEMTLLNSQKFIINKSRSNLKYSIHGLDYKNFKRKNHIELKFND